MFEDQCLGAATRLIERYHWQLLLADQLAARILAQLPAGSPAELERSGITEYCHALYIAASGNEGAARQNLAYGELAQFLLHVLRQRYPSVRADQRDDVLQSTLERIFRSFGSCREPRAFLAFAAYRLLDAVRELQRGERVVAEPLHSQYGEEGSEREIEDTVQPQPEAELLAAERREGIERFLQLYLHDHPLAAQQVAVQRLSLITDLEDDMIARQLGISRNNVYVARSRFASTVRREPKWRKLAQELGILPDEP